MLFFLKNLNLLSKLFWVHLKMFSSSLNLFGSVSAYSWLPDLCKSELFPLSVLSLGHNSFGNNKLHFVQPLVCGLRVNAHMIRIVAILCLLVLTSFLRSTEHYRKGRYMCVISRSWSPCSWNRIFGKASLYGGMVVHICWYILEHVRPTRSTTHSVLHIWGLAPLRSFLQAVLDRMVSWLPIWYVHLFLAASFTKFYGALAEHSMQQWTSSHESRKDPQHTKAALIMHTDLVIPVLMLLQHDKLFMSKFVWYLVNHIQLKAHSLDLTTVHWCTKTV